MTQSGRRRLLHPSSFRSLPFVRPLRSQVRQESYSFRTLSPIDFFAGLNLDIEGWPCPTLEEICKSRNLGLIQLGTSTNLERDFLKFGLSNPIIFEFNNR